MEKLPLVSVIIPTFKRPDTLSRAVDSVISQDYENIEIIVVDDNDPDSPFRSQTESVMERYSGNDSVIYLRHSVNRNGAAARNTGISAAKGKYIAFLDDDDEFLPAKILVQVDKMEGLDDSWGVCYTGYLKYMSDGKAQKSTEKREGKLLVEALARSLYAYGGSNFLIRRCVIDKVKGFDEKFRRNQDIEFLARILIHYKIAYVEGYHVIINYDSRVTKLSMKESLELDRTYLDNFSQQISSLSEKDKKRVLDMIALDRIGSFVRNRMLIKALEYCIMKRVNIILLVRYFLYLLNRKMTNTCYGFRI